MNDVATLKTGNKEIWDYRNISLRGRIQIALRLVLTGIVEIQWKKANNIFIKDEKDASSIKEVQEEKK